MDGKKKLQNWWGGTIRRLAQVVGQEKQYENSYSFLSKIAHGTARAFVARVHRDTEEIRTEHLSDKFLWNACQYVLVIAFEWTVQFGTIDRRTIDAFLERLERLHSEVHPVPADKSE